MGLRFAALERKFGEIDRARAIFIHISQFADPRGDVLRLWTVMIPNEFLMVTTSCYFKMNSLIFVFEWKVWEDFEKNHGNIDTYKEYMRIKRSVL